MPHRVDGSVEARSLAVPHSKNAIVSAVPVHSRLLRPQTGGRRKILINAGDEMERLFC